jgi:hypothetical protein
MIGAILTGISTSLSSAGLDVTEIAYKDLIDGTKNLRLPAVNIMINNARMERITVGQHLPTFKHVVTVSLLLIVPFMGPSIQRELDRKEKISDLIEAIVNRLTNKKFGLSLENPLFPLSWRNITTLELAMVQRQMYQVDFWCSFTTSAEDDDTSDQDITAILMEVWKVPDYDMEHDNPTQTALLPLT